MSKSRNAAPAPSLLVGPSAEGLWIVKDEHGGCGAVFRSRQEALHYVREECEAARPRAVACRFVPALALASLFG